MSRRGPPPLPTAVKDARGTRKKCRDLPGKEPSPEPGKPTIPAAVASTPDAKRMWDALVPQLLRMKVLTKVDGYALEGLCMAYARALEANKAVKKYGMLVTTAWGTLQQNPAIPIARSSWAEVRKFAQEFGLTPSSRTRVRSDAGGDGSEQDDVEEQLFGHSKSRDAKVAGSIGPR